MSLAEAIQDEVRAPGGLEEYITPCLDQKSAFLEFDELTHASMLQFTAHCAQLIISDGIVTIPLGTYVHTGEGENIRFFRVKRAIAFNFSGADKSDPGLLAFRMRDGQVLKIFGTIENEKSRNEKETCVPEPILAIVRKLRKMMLHIPCFPEARNFSYSQTLDDLTHYGLVTQQRLEIGMEVPYTFFKIGDTLFTMFGENNEKIRIETLGEFFHEMAHGSARFPTLPSIPDDADEETKSNLADNYLKKVESWHVKRLRFILRKRLRKKSFLDMFSTLSNGSGTPEEVMQQIEYDIVTSTFIIPTAMIPLIIAAELLSFDNHPFMSKDLIEEEVSCDADDDDNEPVPSQLTQKSCGTSSLPPITNGLILDPSIIEMYVM